MLLIHLAASMVVVWIVSGADTVFGQNFPNRPIRIVTAEIGGGPDFSARLIAQGLTQTLEQNVIVVNRGGDGIPASVVASSRPDGYTMLLSSGALWLEPYLRDKVAYDPVKDFSPITLAASAPTVLVVHPSLAANSVKELIDLAKSKPGALNFASGPTGSTSQLSAELFKAMAGINIVRVAYKGTGPALTDLMGGRVQLMFPNVASVMTHVKSGKLRALAVTSPEPFTLFPEIPTVAASGLPGYESLAMFGIFGPAKMPPTLIERLNQEIVRVLNQADIKEKFSNLGIEVVGSSPAQLSAKMKAEMARLGKVIIDAGIREK